MSDPAITPAANSILINPSVPSGETLGPLRVVDKCLVFDDSSTIYGYSEALEPLWTLSAYNQVNGWAVSGSNLYVQDGCVLMMYDIAALTNEAHETDAVVSAKQPVAAFNCVHHAWFSSENESGGSWNDFPKGTQQSATGYSHPVVVVGDVSTSVFVLTPATLFAFPAELNIEQNEAYPLATPPATPWTFSGFFDSSHGHKTLQYLAGVDGSEGSVVTLEMHGSGPRSSTGEPMAIQDFQWMVEAAELKDLSWPMSVSDSVGFAAGAGSPPALDGIFFQLAAKTSGGSATALYVIEPDSGDFELAKTRVAVFEALGNKKSEPVTLASSVVRSRANRSVYGLVSDGDTSHLMQWKLPTATKASIWGAVWVLIDSCLALCSSDLAEGPSPSDIAPLATAQKAATWALRTATAASGTLGQRSPTQAEVEEMLGFVEAAGYGAGDAAAALALACPTISTAWIVSGIQGVYGTSVWDMAKILYARPFGLTTPEEIISALQPAPYSASAANIAQVLHASPFERSPGEILGALLPAPYELTSAWDLVRVLFTGIPSLGSVAAFETLQNFDLMQGQSKIDLEHFYTLWIKARGQFGYAGRCVSPKGSDEVYFVVGRTLRRVPSLETYQGLFEVKDVAVLNPDEMARLNPGEPLSSTVYLAHGEYFMPYLVDGAVQNPVAINELIHGQWLKYFGFNPPTQNVPAGLTTGRSIFHPARIPHSQLTTEPATKIFPS